MNELPKDFDPTKCPVKGCTYTNQNPLEVGQHLWEAHEEPKLRENPAEALLGALLGALVRRRARERR